MAISKKRVIETVSAAMAQVVLSSENVIDAKLRNFVDGNRIIVSYSELPFPKDADLPFRERVIAELISRYQQAGWTVSSDSDQREGSWLNFS